MDLYDYGDPFVAWQEEDASREEYEGDEMNVEDIKTEVVKILITKYDFLENVAESTVEDHVRDNPSDWHENSDAEQLAEFLAEDENV